MTATTAIANGPSHSPHRPAPWWFRNVGRALLLIWGCFWMWFITSVALSEGPPSFPYALSMLAAVIATALTPLRWPRFGAVLALALAAAAAVFFWKNRIESHLLISGMPALAGALLLIGSRRVTRA